MVHGIYAADSRALSVRSTFPVLWDAMFAGKRSGSLVWNLVKSGLFGGGKGKTPVEEEKAGEEREAWASLGALDAERKSWSVYGLRGGLGILTQKMQDAARAAGVEIRAGCAVSDVRLADGGKVTVSLGRSPPTPKRKRARARAEIPHSSRSTGNATKRTW